MYVRIRRMVATKGEADLVLDVCKTDPIEELQEMIFKKLGTEPKEQRLFYRGKLLIPGHRIIDYDIQLNNVIQLAVKTTDSVTLSTTLKVDDSAKGKQEFKSSLSEFGAECRYYQVNDRIDLLDSNNGAWFEAKIIKIFSRVSGPNLEEKDLFFKVQIDRGVETYPLQATFDEIRPRSYYIYPCSELQAGMIVLVNYNLEDPSKRGFWYDFEIEKFKKEKLSGTLLIGVNRTRIENVSIKFSQEVMRIEKVQLLADGGNAIPNDLPLRKIAFYCEKCKDVLNKKCGECGCKVCMKKENEGYLLLCDECDDAYHLHCLDPPLADVPSDPEWYCPECKTDETEIVRAGEALKVSKKKMKQVSYNSQSAKKWGKGMACVGRTTECTIVPKHFYGPIPGIEVGTCWKFRTQVSEAGIHRPHVAGIHGRAEDGAYSLVLSGGYEDDIDYGDEFYYTGSGGRDLSGNRRINKQSSDQQLTRTNKALALNCNTTFNDVEGGEAEDWKAGKPVRVVRNYNLRKHSKFAPADGNRYDGIYKVVKYFPTEGISGFTVWRFLLRRDDPAPAPWAAGGQELEMIVPDGYHEAKATANKIRNKKTDITNDETVPKSKKRRVDHSNNNSLEENMNNPKKTKISVHILSSDIKQLINKDSCNENLWKECLEELENGKQKFYNKVKESFSCICCQEVLHQPVTMGCNHNICKNCLERSFSAEIFVCPVCRFDLGRRYDIRVNENLDSILRMLFPGYNSKC